MAETKTDTSNWWPCACVKRDKENNLSHIKLHSPSAKRCVVCKATRPKDSDLK